MPKKNGPCLSKTLRCKIAKLRMRTEMEEQFYTTLFHFIITWCNNTNKYNWRSLAHLCWKDHIPSNTNKYNWRSLAHLCWKEHIRSWRASEASETLSGLFNWESLIYILEKWFPFQGERAHSLLLFLYMLIERRRRRGRQTNNSLPKVVTFFTDYKYTTLP